MQRPVSCLLNGGGKDGKEDVTRVRKIGNKELIPVNRWTNNKVRASEDLIELKNQLSQVSKRNERYLKMQVKLLNQLKQKNLEKNYYKMELKRERRLFHLLQLETSRYSTTTPNMFSRVISCLGNILIANSVIYSYIFAHLDRWKSGISSWWCSRLFSTPHYSI